MKEGFTLIELLLVVSIIGILATFTAVLVTNARADSRDSVRIANLTQIMTAIELFKSIEGAYPIAGACGENGVLANAGKLCGSYVFQSASKKYISRLPQDPQGGDFAATINSSSYSLSANLENGNKYICSNTACNEGGENE